MPRHAEATQLKVAGRDFRGREVLLSPEAAGAWIALRREARKDGIELLLISGFRSYRRQAGIIKRKLAAGQTLREVLRYSAYPGFSQHHTGRAVDIGCPGCPPLVREFERTAAYAWLRRHAGGFGFKLTYPAGNPFGMGFEPWHWFHRGNPSGAGRRR